MTGQDIVNLAQSRKGDRYVYGAIAPKDQPNYQGPFDCAELMAWAIYQAIKKLYGCANDNSTQPGNADAGTGYFGRDADAGILKKISLDEAATIPGALLLREDQHIVMVASPNCTIEAMGADWGVTNGKINRRRWSYGVLVPGISYTPFSTQPLPTLPPKIILRLGISNNVTNVKLVQNLLSKLGYYHGTIDGIFGPATFSAVKTYQISKGLTPDGEVGQMTETALGIQL